MQDVLGSPMGILHVVRSDCLYAPLPGSHSCVLLACSRRADVQEADFLRSYGWRNASLVVGAFGVPARLGACAYVLLRSMGRTRP